MSKFFLPQNILPFILISLFLSAATLLIAAKPLAAAQQLSYSAKKFLKWSVKRRNKLYFRLSSLAILCTLSFFVISLSLFFMRQEIASLVGFVGIFMFFSVYIYADKKFALKIPLKNTRRMLRLKTVFFTLSFLLCLCLFCSLFFLTKSLSGKLIFNLRFLPFALLPLLVPSICYLSLSLSALFESKINRKYIIAATGKIKNSKIKVIGITGSFAKTSVKNILTTILSQKYKVLSSKGSYNTPLGVALTINGADLESYDYLILEMGAKNIGDIKELCQIAPPDIAAITGICSQHLESFLSLENIENTKYEIIECLKSGGGAVFGDSAKKLYDRFDGKKILAGTDIYAKNLNLSSSGLEFDVCKDEEVYHLKSVLLGSHNADNIIIAAALASLVGMSLEDIAKAAEKVTFEKHRLELIHAQNGINVLDDSYNANIKGAEAALSVLSLFSGKKAVVTPGIVELGILEESENYKLGQKLAAVADLVILVGEALTDSISKGLRNSGFCLNDLFIIPSLDSLSEILQRQLKSGDTVLFLNDLPDIYNYS